MASLEVDATDFINKAGKFTDKVLKATDAAIFGVGQEILRIGMTGPPPQVPHDDGILQGTGHTEPVKNHETLVGYNTVYAARLHEHPEYRFQKGRKGKYLEDPIKNNLNIFKRFIADTINKTVI